LGRVLGWLAVFGVFAVAVAILAGARAAESDDPDRDAARTACAVAATTLKEPDEAAGKAAVRILAAAGVTDADDAPRDCVATWRAAGAWAAGLSYGILGSACTSAADSLRKADSAAALRALRGAGVTAPNAELLSDDCRATWLIAASSDGDEPTADRIDAATAEAACALATRQLARGDEAEARAALTSVGGRPAAEVGGCSATWSILAALSPAPDDETAPQEIGGWWETFVEEYISPLTVLGASMLAASAAYLILARLFVELPWVRDLISSRGQRRTAAIGGAAAILVAVGAGAWVAVCIGQGRLSGGWIVVLFAAIALFGLLGAYAVSCAIATLRRIHVTVKSNDDVALGEPDVVRALRELAVSTGGSLELQSSPILADVDENLTKLSDNKLVAAMQALALFLVGIKSWTAEVVVRSDREATLTLNRNGRSDWTGALSLEHPRLAPLEPLPNAATHPAILAQFVAAHILVRMALAYPDEMRPGLNGATKGVSVAIQRVVQTWYSPLTAARRAEALLVYALDRDPENALAAATLQRFRYRTSRDVSDLVRFSRWLDESLRRGGSPGATTEAPSREVPAPKNVLDMTGEDLPPVSATHGSRLALGLINALAAATRNLTALVESAVVQKEPNEPPEEHPEPPPLAEPSELLDVDGLRDAARKADERARAALASAKAEMVRARKIADALDGDHTADMTEAANAMGVVAEAAHGTARAAGRTLAAARRRKCAMLAEKAITKAREAASAAEAVVAVRERLHSALARQSRDEVVRATDAALGHIAAADTAILEEESNRRAMRIRLAIEAEALKRAKSVLESAKPERDHGPTVLPLAADLDSMTDGIVNDVTESDIAFASVRADLSYSIACWLVRWQGAPFGDPRVAHLFDVALAAATYRDAVEDDPELVSAPDRKGHIALVRKAQAISRALTASDAAAR